MEKIVLIGAGSAMFTLGLVADVLATGWNCEIGLVDIDPEALKVAELLTRKMVEHKAAKVSVTASTERRDILPGATTVVTTIGVGGRRAWEQDVFIPRKHRIFQPVGDTVMPGGASRCLRMIPAMIEIAHDIERLAPNALFFNYGNPMTAVTRAVRKTTGLPVVGLCHGVMHVARYLHTALEIEPDEFSYTAVGVNHLTWFTELYERGTDITHKMRAYAERRVREGSVFENQVGDDGRPPVTDDGAPFSWQLCHLFGAFPAVMDRHVVEFFPQLFTDGRYMGKTLGKDIISFEDTIRHGDSVFAEMKRHACRDDALPLDYFQRGEGEHEQVLEIVDAIRNDTGRVFSANLPNQGQVPNLPIDSILETPARASAGGLRPIAFGPLPNGIAGTLATRLHYVETIVEAALEGSRKKFIQALILDGSIQSPDTAVAIADELLEAHADYLPQFR